jgi:hypothetical protein
MILLERLCFFLAGAVIAILSRLGHDLAWRRQRESQNAQLQTGQQCDKCFGSLPCGGDRSWPCSNTASPLEP